MRRLAHACICTSLVAAAASAGDELPSASAVVALELEAGLARQSVVYLHLDPGRRRLEIKARGVVLDSVNLAGIELVSHQPLVGGPVPAPPPVPAVWKVTSAPSDREREPLTPETLRPMQDEEEEPVADASKPSPTPTVVAEPPASFRASLDMSWDLCLTNSLPPQGLWSRFTAAVKDGWHRMRGHGESHGAAITLAMAPEDVKRLYHVIRAGMTILVTADTP
jgi:hypothetical protein